MTIRTAALPRTPVEDSLVAVEVAGEVLVKEVRATGLALEATALIIAGHRARKSLEPIEVTPELLAVLKRPAGEPAPGDLARVLVGVEHLGPALLERLVATAMPEDLLELLAARAPRSTQAEPWSLPPADAAWAAKNSACVVFTDGSACKSPFEVGSWAYSAIDGPSGSGVLEHVGNSYAAERRAVLEALRATGGATLVLTDHVFDRDMGPDTPLRLLKVDDELSELLRARPVRLAKVPAHSTCEPNLVVDRLASTRLDEALGALLADPAKARAWRAKEAELSRLLGAHKDYRQRRQEFFAPRHAKAFAKAFAGQPASKAQKQALIRRVEARFPQWPLYLESY
jgi:ribonuclease HI